MMMMNTEVLQVVHEKEHWMDESQIDDPLPREREESWPNIQEEVTIIVDKKSRRKSWHAIKFERKRRKGVVDPSTPPEARQKRPSWWNIFASSQWPRSRRASQDTGRVTKDNFPWLRSKSRSVDHGIATPFDLDALRAKVDGHLDKSIERVERTNFAGDRQRLSEIMTDNGFTKYSNVYFSVDNEDNYVVVFINNKQDLNSSTNSLSEKKRSGPPENTTLYTVVDRDTLTSVAARFDTTPTELTKLNRLATPYIFPGQQLYVPLRETVEEESEGSTPVEESHEDLPKDEKDLLDTLRPASPKPGHVERVRTPSCAQSSTERDEESPIFRERFLKINVRHITDGQGVVGGVLLVTPNAVMFDPNVSDPLVIEHGPEAYGVIAPMEFVVNAAIYNDIAHMRVGHTQTSQTEKPEIYYPKSESSVADMEPDSLLVKDETFPELAGDDAESVCSCTEREGDAFPKAFDRDLVTPTNTDDPEHQQKQLEERRKSLLDHHWPVSSRDRASIDVDEMPIHSSSMQEELIENIEEEETISKESCHDSGIDIRESSLPPVVPIPTKKQYSDADIVLSKDWVPPITIAPTNVTNTHEMFSPRKKNNSVSFSLDSSSDLDPTVPPLTSSMESKDENEKAENRKNKMLKRLSYPLSWMETLGGEKDEEKPPSHPNSADSHHGSVFSKVFSSSPINLVDFGSGLFNKTPSEESGGSGGPQSSGSGGPPLTDSPRTDSTSFFPSNIMNTVGASVGAVGASVGAMGASVGASVGAMGASVGASVGAMGASVGASVGALGATVGSSVKEVGATVKDMGRSSVGTFMRQPTETSKSKVPPPRLDYRSMVSVDDMPELFVSFDKLIPRPARPSEDPPLYLRLRMGKPMFKPISKSTPLMSYGKKKMRPEYWFSVPKNRADELYKFIQAWVPDIYGELNEEQIKERGYSLVEMDTELWSEDPTPSNSRHNSQDGDISELTKDSWELIKAPYVKIYSIIKTQTMSADGSDEVLPMSEEYRKAFLCSAAPSLDVELTPPDLIGNTEILTYEHRENLCRHLPARAEGYAWTLVFSTSQHGFSLNSMYRKMYKLESPILLVIEDTDNNVFGALTSCALQVSEHFYGTGESLLFRFSPEFQVYNWTGENLYFIKGNNESLSIGAGDGKFGLWLDGDLYLGRTEMCKTYGNDPLTPSVDFVVKTLECWAFVSS